MTGTSLRVPVQRRFSDIDALHHVNNVVYFDYLQEARVHLMRAGGLVTGMGDFTHVVVRQEIDYRRPMYLSDEPAVVEIWVSRIGRSSYTISYRVHDEHDVVTAEAKTVMVQVDPADGTPLRVSDELRAALTAVLIEDESA